MVFSAAPDNRPVFSTTQNNVTPNSTSTPIFNRVSFTAHLDFYFIFLLFLNFQLGGMTIRATVKFSYDPQLDDELRLNKGDTIIVLDKSSDGWWKGEINGQSGWFPSNYVEEVTIFSLFYDFVFRLLKYLGIT